MKNEKNDGIQSYFGVVTKGETYLNLVYLLIAFPLGLVYFISLVVGFSVGLSLIIIWVGLLILALLFPAIWFAIAFERIQAIHLLKQDIPPMEKPVTTHQTLFEKIKTFFTNPVTWKGLLYLFLKFPIGIIQFTILVTGLSIIISFLAAPFIYPWVSIDLGLWNVDSFSEGLGLFVIAILLFPALLHFFNFIAQLNGKFARVMLGQTELNNNQPIQGTPSNLIAEPDQEIVTETIVMESVEND